MKKYLKYWMFHYGTFILVMFVFPFVLALIVGFFRTLGIDWERVMAIFFGSLGFMAVFALLFITWAVLFEGEKTKPYKFLVKKRTIRPISPHQP
jgi:hypothetical protein